MEICEWAQNAMNFPGMHDVLSKMIGGNAAVSAIRFINAEILILYSSYMPPQSNVDFLIFNRHLPDSSFFSRQFPVFILISKPLMHPAPYQYIISNSKNFL